ncbi:MAG: hypothetical protein Q8R60_18015 [Mycobacteriales bacterium]|nr:hypothetical protein [Mycobacteriales bacterium]
MKRSLALLAAVAVVATPLAASAAPKPPKKTTRTVTFDYTAFTAGTVSVAASFSLNNCDLPGQCFDFDTVKGEKTVKLSAVDATGLPVAMQVFTNDDYAGNVVTYCGTGTLKVSAKSANLVSVRMTLSDTCAGLPTEGTVTGTITNF